MKKRTKLKQSEILKINSRYYNKIDEFKLKSEEELNKLSLTKMSNTDRNALTICLSKFNKPKVNIIDGNDKE